MSDLERNLFESKKANSYREFLYSKFSKLLYLTIWEYKWILDPNIESVILRVFSRTWNNISDNDKRTIDFILELNEFTNRVLSKLSEDDIEKLSNWYDNPNNSDSKWSPKKWEYWYEEYLKGIFKDFIRFILKELKYRQINNEVENVINNVNWILNWALILSWDRYEVVRIWENYYIYDKAKKYIIPKTFRLTDIVNGEDDPEISMSENRDELFTTANWDILAEIKLEWNNSYLMSLREWRIKTPSFETLELVKEKDWKTIVLFSPKPWRSDNEYFCIESQEFIEIN